MRAGLLLDYIEETLATVLSMVYHYSIPALVFGCLFTFLVMQAHDRGWRQLGRDIWQRVRIERHYLWKTGFFAYVYFIWDCTLLDRQTVYANPWQWVMGCWWIQRGTNGQWDLSCIYNFLFFIPFGFLLLKAGLIKTMKKGRNKEAGFEKILLKACQWGFLMSLAVESMQAVTKLGTFQLSDLTYNTLGSVLGAGVYIGLQKLYNRRASAIQKDED